MAITEQEKEQLLNDARILRRASRLFDVVGEMAIISTLIRKAEQLQNRACEFEEPAVPYDNPPEVKHAD
jgi:hypothetical protein